MNPFFMSCLLAGVGLSAVAGERIIFSSRDGRQVQFDYSRSVRLLPPRPADVALAPLAVPVTHRRSHRYSREGPGLSRL